MKKYCVQRVEVYRQDVYINAESPERALELVGNGLGNEQELYFDYVLEPNEWKVFEVKQ